MSADTWLGATGWARGSQEWRGMRPAFGPVAGEDEEPAPPADPAEVRDGEVDVHRAPDGSAVPDDEDGRGRHEGHELPEPAEARDVARREAPGERSEEAGRQGGG